MNKAVYISKANRLEEKPVSLIKDYMALSKFTLSFTVVFSCVVSYLLSPNVVFDLKMVVLLFVAGMLVTGSANAINQAIEKDTDAVMKRTMNRPVASGRMSQSHAFIFALITGVAGVGMMWYFFNFQSALLSLLSLFIYGYIYTPLKTKNAVSVLVGGFPGAFPCLIGWVAGFSEGGNNSWTGGLILFAIQFIWQFPHFWAIAWVAHKDYTKAGFKLLPSEKGPTKNTALQTILYSVLMIPVGMLPFVMGDFVKGIDSQIGLICFIIVLISNIFMVIQSVRLYIHMDVKSARRVMFSSYIYLPIVLLTLLADKI